MLTVELHFPDGSIERRLVQQAEFIRICPYRACHQEFHTTNQDQLYCRKTHQIRAWETRHFGTISDARAALLTTVGIA